MIADYISGLDHEGMRLIEQCDVHGFASYLERSGNTICGRHPIGVLLALLARESDAGGSTCTPQPSSPQVCRVCTELASNAPFRQQRELRVGARKTAGCVKCVCENTCSECLAFKTCPMGWPE